MKKLILSIITLAIVSAHGFSQSSDTPFRMAFVLSPQVSWINSDHKDVTSGGNFFGYNFGLVVDKFFATNYAITTGLTINTTGGTLKYESIPTTNAVTVIEKQDYRLKYLEVPFAIKLKSSDANRTVFNGQFGLSGQINVKATDGDGNNISDDVRLLNMGYHFGGGVEQSLGGSTSLLFGVIFNNGLTDVTSRSGWGDKSVLHRLVFQVGMIF